MAGYLQHSDFARGCIQLPVGQRRLTVSVFTYINPALAINSHGPWTLGLPSS